MSTTSELRDLADVELLARLDESKQKLFELRFQNATGQLDDTTSLGRLKREIARVNTLIREREIAAAEELATAGEES